MNARNPPDSGWFEGLESGDREGAIAAIRTGECDQPRPWPAVATDRGVVEDSAEYYDWLREATLEAARRGVEEQERADDQQLIHAIRALDDCQRVANELTERVGEWAGTLDPDVRVDPTHVRNLAERGVQGGVDPEAGDSEAEESKGSGSKGPGSVTPVESRVQSLAARTVALEDEATSLRSFIERTAPEVAPNLSTLAGPLLAARLIAHAGGLEELAKKPAGTVQVLGAEDALFAHLQGGAPAPKHGVIYTHEMVRTVPRDERGSAARALAGKLAIAARIDHYSGDFRPGLEAELGERIDRIRERGEP